MRGVLLAALWCGALAAGETIDRIAVTVGSRVITESEIVQDLRIAALIDHKPVDLSGEQKRRDADRLVDQLLILNEAGFSRIGAPSPEDVAKLLDPVKTSYGTDYRAALERYHVTEAELIDHLTTGLRALRFTDVRFRPEVQVNEEDLHDFYNQLVDDSKRNNAPPPKPFDESREEVENLMVEQRVSQALDRWLGEQRTQTEILYREEAFK
jgi:hypothetical protein